MKKIFQILALLFITLLTAQKKIFLSDDLSMFLPENFVEIPMSENNDSSDSELKLKQRIYTYVDPTSKNEFLFINLNTISGLDFFDNKQKDPVVVEATKNLLDDKMKSILDNTNSNYKILEKTKLIQINAINVYQSVATQKENFSGSIIEEKIYFINIFNKKDLINLKMTINSADKNNLYIQKESILNTLNFDSK